MEPVALVRARAGTNEEALEYYRSRSRAPGVAEGGGERNVYCLRCDGVVPYQRDLKTCPHCGEDLGGAVRRYFNWVEIDEPPRSDVRALVPWLVLGVVVVGLVGWALWRWTRG